MKRLPQATLFIMGALALAACSSSSPGTASQQNAAVNGIIPKAGASVETKPRQAEVTTSTSITVPPSSSTTPQVSVPDVIGQYATPTRIALLTVGLRIKAVNAVCAKGNLTSESVALSLVLIGPNGSTPLVTGSMVPPKSVVGVTWSGCYGKGVVVPDVVGMLWKDGTRAVLQAGGLHWACTADPSAPQGSPNPKAPGVIVAQTPAAGTIVATGTVVTLSADVCPGQGG